MKPKQLIIYTIIVAIASGAMTKYLWPNIETQIKIEEKEVIKKDIRTIIRERTNPDGSTEKETEIIDHSKEKRDKEFEQTITRKKDWYIAAGTSVNQKDLTPVYNLQVNRRILGPFYLGGQVNTKREVSVQIGFEF